MEEEEEDMNGDEYEAQEMEDQFEAAAASFSGTSEVRRKFFCLLLFEGTTFFAW